MTEAIETLQQHGHLLVRRVAQRDDSVSDALFDVASGGRSTWTLADWEAMLDELDACQLTVGAWLREGEGR